MARPSQMNRNRSTQLPQGKWEMPDELLTSALGHFILSWALVEATIEIAIAKELGVDAHAGSIVTAVVQFRGRASILSSLLNRDPKRNANALRAIKELTTVTDRNDMLHGVAGGNKKRYLVQSACYWCEIQQQNRDI